jgi:hypothetical protein
MHSAVMIGSQMIKLQKLQHLFGGYGINATAQTDASTEALIAKLKASVGGTVDLTDAERLTLMRALDWCVRRDVDGINKKPKS